MDVRVAVFLREPLPSIVLPTMDVAASSVHLCRLGDIHGQRVWCLHMLYMMITEHCRKRQSCQPKARAPGIDCNQVLLVPCPACHHSVIDQRMLCSHGACSGDAAPVVASMLAWASTEEGCMAFLATDSLVEIVNGDELGTSPEVLKDRFVAQLQCLSCTGCPKSK